MGDYYIVNCNEWVSLREHADSTSLRLAKVPLGAKVTHCYDTIFDFMLCEYNGELGFIKKQYLMFEDEYERRYSSTNRTSSRNAASTGNDKYNLDNFGYRYVITEGRGKLVFQASPGGSFLYDYKYYDGDEIYVNLKWRQNGYALAYKNGQYGYVDASYIDW